MNCGKNLLTNLFTFCKNTPLETQYNDIFYKVINCNIVLGYPYSSDVICFLEKLKKVVKSKRVFFEIKQKIYRYKKNLLSSLFWLERSNIIDLSQKNKIIDYIKKLIIQLENLNKNQESAQQEAKKILFEITLVHLDLLLFAYLKKSDKI